MEQAIPGAVTLTAGDLCARHIGLTISFGEVSDELRQIYHIGDYPGGDTYIHVGAMAEVEHVLAHGDTVTITKEGDYR